MKVYYVLIFALLIIVGALVIGFIVMASIYRFIERRKGKKQLKIHKENREMIERIMVNKRMTKELLNGINWDCEAE